MTRVLLVAIALVAVAVLLTRGGVPDLPREAVAKDQLVAVISTGERVELDQYLHDEEWTVVVFTARWCPGCRSLDPELDRLIRDAGTVRLRRVDIGSWDSPVARQHDVRRLPSLRLYAGPRLVTADTGRVLRILRQG